MSAGRPAYFLNLASLLLGCLLLSACGGGGGGGSTPGPGNGGNPLPVSDTELDWDEGNWDQENWQ
jgi:hypothetical protein